MYLELDGDDVAVTYIKDVIFNTNRQDVEVLRMTKVSLETHFLNKLQRASHYIICTPSSCFIQC